MSDINITPLTDVMMVLLIIFMISSPVLLARGMEVHLPQVEEPPMLAQEDHVLYLSSDGQISLDGNMYLASDLPSAFEGLVAEADKTGETVSLFLRADETVTYGDITHVMDLATSSGIGQISLVQDVLAQPAPPAEVPPAPLPGSPETPETAPAPSGTGGI
jgi:biopolymer transport protein TolR